MTFTNIYNQIDTQDDFINCDRFLDIEFDLEISHEELDLYDNQNRE